MVKIDGVRTVDVIAMKMIVKGSQETSQIFEYKVHRGDKYRNDQSSRYSDYENMSNSFNDASYAWLSNQYRQKNSKEGNLQGVPSWKEVFKGIMREEVK